MVCNRLLAFNSLVIFLGEVIIICIYCLPACLVCAESNEIDIIIIEIKNKTSVCIKCIISNVTVVVKHIEIAADEISSASRLDTIDVVVSIVISPAFCGDAILVELAGLLIYAIEYFAAVLTLKNAVDDLIGVAFSGNYRTPIND